MTQSPAIRLEGSCWFRGERLFGPIDLTLTGGECTCLLGASGAGKTTILRLIAGLETGGRFEGTISASDGQPIESRVAYMAQSDLLLPWLDVAGNVTIGNRLRGDRVDLAKAQDLIRRVGLSGHEHKTPAALSGGMRQRAALARTLMEDRPVVLLDEAFSALDAGTRAEMQELASGLLKGRTVLLVTHDPGEAARLGHRIVLMGPQGLRDMDVPPAAPVRPFDDTAVFAAQAELLAAMRGRL